MGSIIGIVSDRTMATTLRRAQVLLEKDDYELIEKYARERGLTVSGIIRDLVAKGLVAEIRKERALAAVEWMAAQNLPTDDWENIERELDRRYEACDDVPLR